MAGAALAAALAASSAAPVGAADAPSPAPPEASPPAPAPVTPAPTVSPPAIPALDSATLEQRLEEVMATHGETLGAATVGLAVVDDTGRVRFEAGSTEPLLPASTMKTVTAASVLGAFGARDRVVTRAVATAAIGADGVVDGDLVLVGGGDPSLTSEQYRVHVYPSRPASNIEELADRVVAAGVRRVTGDVVGDGTGFGPLQLAAGWPPRYLGSYDARRLSGLEIDTGVQVRVSIPSGGPVRVVQEHADDPALDAAWEFAKALVDRGVVLESRVRRATAPTDPAHEVARISSPPLRDLLTFMLRESDNHLADTLVRTAALERLGEGSWSGADRAARAALADLGLDTTGLVVADGSGLSRLDRVTPALLARTDAALADQHGTRWSEMLAIAGEEGTLANRLRGTSGQGRFFAKTGTLSDVKALVGHVVAADGRRLHLALLANDVPDGQAWRISLLGDDLVLALSDALDDCQRVLRVDPGVTPSPTAPPPLPPTLADPAWERQCRAA